MSSKDLKQPPFLRTERAETNRNQSLRSEIKLARLIFAKKTEGGLHYQNPETAQVREAVDFAGAVTGVREEFLMGMLVVESDLGRNVGKCTYGEVEEGARQSYKEGLLNQRAWNTFLKRKDTIKKIARDLGYDYKNLRVSCNPSRYSGTGGAMGVGQFMPDTWLEYKDRVAGIVGKENPDPWNLTDGIVAMAIKLSDVPGVTRHNRYAEKNAAKIYLSGGTSRRYNWYANKIQYWARNYHRLM